MKTVALIFWLVSTAAFVGLVPEPAALWLKVVAVMLLLIHSIEFIIFQKAIKTKSDGGLKSFGMTMFYGVIYFKP